MSDADNAIGFTLSLSLNPNHNPMARPTPNSNPNPNLNLAPEMANLEPEASEAEKAKAIGSTLYFSLTLEYWVFKVGPVHGRTVHRW